MNNDLPRTGSAELAEILNTMNEKGDFPVSVLTDRDGFPIASAAMADQDSTKQAAVVALLQKTAAQVRNQLGFGQTDEITMFDMEGRKLVCRLFNANGHELVLAVMVADKRQTYRRLTNIAVNNIKQAWSL
ncbi:MAG: hypothetical protein DWQ07_23680 [Chloroflexi bacterium]|nr:MAG: hypothetical protein DWQ07_23680 [Chloroflexota bacterium]MBL1194150.1 hypothetical protein [Chloroflexota bacterium]NOH11443.1 hypothetical protein [Chloroflexota bacterium]